MNNDFGVTVTNKSDKLRFFKQKNWRMIVFEGQSTNTDGKILNVFNTSDRPKKPVRTTVLITYSGKFYIGYAYVDNYTNDVTAVYFTPGGNASGALGAMAVYGTMVWVVNDTSAS